MNDDEQKGFWGCVTGLVQIVGLFLVLTWPLLLLAWWANQP